MFGPHELSVLFGSKETYLSAAAPNVGDACRLAPGNGDEGGEDGEDEEQQQHPLMPPLARVSDPIEWKMFQRRATPCLIAGRTLVRKWGMHGVPDIDPKAAKRSRPAQK